MWHALPNWQEEGEAKEPWAVTKGHMLEEQQLWEPTQQQKRKSVVSRVRGVFGPQSYFAQGRELQKRSPCSGGTSGEVAASVPSSSFSTFTNIPLRSPNKKPIGSPNWTLVQSFLSVMDSTVMWVSLIMCALCVSVFHLQRKSLSCTNCSSEIILVEANFNKLKN